MKFSGWKPYTVPQVLSSDLVPTGSRSGLHLSAVLDRMAAAAGEKYGDDDPTHRFVAGFVFETAVEYINAGMSHDEAMDAAFRRYMMAGLRKDVVTQVRGEKDGIRMTPDAFAVVAGELESYKVTAKKLPATQADFEEKFWRWVAQEASYCHMLGVDTVRWAVLWLRGNYRDIQGPVIMEATATWTADELAKQWSIILTHAEALR